MKSAVRLNAYYEHIRIPITLVPFSSTGGVDHGMSSLSMPHPFESFTSAYSTAIDNDLEAALKVHNDGEAPMSWL